MHDFIGWLNSNAGAATVLATLITAVATVILSATTIVYAWHTWQLAKENRLLRKAGTDPQVVAYANLNSRVWGAIDFVIANVGKGAAQNIAFKIVAGGKDFAQKNIQLPHEGVKLAFLPQGDQIATFLGMGWDLLPDPPLAPFTVEIQYDDLKSVRYREKFEISILAFEGIVRLGTPPEQEIAKAVEQIAKNVEKWTSRGLRIEAKS
jgi:hypothetical protein